MQSSRDGKLRVRKRKLFFKIFIYLFMLHQVLVVAYGIFQLLQNPQDLATNSSDKLCYFLQVFCLSIYFTANCC